MEYLQYKNKKKFYENIVKLHIEKNSKDFFFSTKRKNILDLGAFEFIINFLCKNFKNVHVAFYEDKTKPKNFNKISDVIEENSIDFITCINTFDYLSISQSKILLSEIYKLMNKNSYCMIVINRILKEIMLSDFGEFIKNFGFEILEKGSFQKIEDYFIISKTT